MATLTRKYTPDEVLALPGQKKYELVDGELVEKPFMGAKGSWVQSALDHAMRAYCMERSWGHVLVEVPIACYPDDINKMHRPDVAFIRKGRLAEERIPEGNITIPPDLAVEVVSPTDLLYDVERKVLEYLAAGVRRVWVVNPDTRAVRIFCPDGNITEIREDKDLTDEEILPGFRCPVRSLFPPK